MAQSDAIGIKPPFAAGCGAHLAATKAYRTLGGSADAPRPATRHAPMRVSAPREAGGTSVRRTSKICGHIVDMRRARPFRLSLIYTSALKQLPYLVPDEGFEPPTY